MELFWWCFILLLPLSLLFVFIFLLGSCQILLIGMEIAYGIEPSVGIYQRHIPFNFSSENN
jgi:hypothetical protein